MEKHRTYQIDRRYFHFVGKPCWAHWAHSSSHSGSSWRDSRERACHPHWHCRTHGSSCRPGWTDLQQQQLHQPLVHGRAYRKSARRNGLLLYQLHTNRNSLVQDRGRRQCSKERQLQPWRLCHRARESVWRLYECNIRHPRVEHWQGRVETLTTSIYLGEIRDRFFFLFTKISEYYLDSNSASRKLIKLSNHGTDCFSQPAHRSRIYVGCSQLWHCSTSLHLSGAAQAAERRQGHGRRPCTHGCCSRYVGRCNQERALSPFFNSFCYGWQNPTCCRWNSFYWSYFSQHCKSFIDCYYSAQCNCWDVHCRTRS